MAAFFDGNDLHLVGAVGFELFGDFFTHGDALYALSSAGRDRDLTIYLNSPGGIVTEGEGIANAIMARTGKTTVVVAGMAMSAATIIACAADECVMSSGSLYMVHEPQVSFLYADSTELARSTTLQQLITSTYVEAYARKTGKPERQIREWMKAETYFGADEAVEAGFADRKSAEVVDFADAAIAFPYNDNQIFAHAPARLVALAKQQNWSRRDRTPSKEPPMSQSRNSDAATAHASATARIKAIMQADAANGRRELAEHLAFDTTLDEEAALAILAKAPFKDEFDEPDRPILGAGMGFNYSSRPRGDGGIVAAMKQRHGQK